MINPHAGCDRQDITRAKITQNVGVVAIIDNTGLLLAISDNHNDRGWIRRPVALDDIGCINVNDVFHTDVATVIEQSIEYSKHQTPPTSRTYVCDIFFAYRTYVTMLSQLDGRLVLEIEDFEREKLDVKSIVDTFNVIGKLTANTLMVDTVNELCREVFKTTLYDRAMTYMFLDDLSGEVVFEMVRNENVKSSFLGLRFPPGDIPLPARKAYVENPVRFIADADADPCHLLQKNPDLSLSKSFLRGCVMPHRAYLRNMGVRSSLSIAITNIDGGLWGLVALHSYSKSIVPKIEDRVSYSILSAVTSKHIQAIERSERLDVTTRINNLVDQIDAKESLGAFIVQNEVELLRLFRVDSITLFSPADDPIMVGKYGVDPHDIPIDRDALACGTLRNPVRSFACLTILGYSIILTRKCSYKSTKWAGNPTLVEKAGTDLPSDLVMPRRSFEKYLGHKSEHPPPFTKHDKVVFYRMGDMLKSVIHQIHIECAERKVARAKRASNLAEAQSDENYAFFANMSHELRAPLHAITGVFDIMNNLTSDDEQVARYSKIGLATCKDMMKTLNNILSVVRKTHEEKKHEVRLVMVREIFHSTTEGLRVFAKCNGVRLVTVFECDQTQFVRIDTEKAGHVYNNIISNAIKFSSPKSSPVVEVRIHLVDSRADVSEMWLKVCAKYAGSYDAARQEKLYDNAGSMCRWLFVTTTDNGCGVYEKDMPKIFSMFTQVGEVTTKKFSSTGLGLHICLNTVLALYGFLGIASTPEQGSTFAFAIPVECNSETYDRPDVERHDSDRRFENDDPVHDQPTVFVVVDDSKVNLMIAKKQIERGFPGATVHTAGDGKAGVDMIMSLHREGVNIDGIFMDYHMPVMSGLEAVRLIRKECRLPITMLTADITDESRQSMISSGSDYILLKPSRPDQLLAKCRDMLQLKKC